MPPVRKSAAGRPKDMGKCAAIVKAAQGQFLKHGFEGASMDAIAAAAGVSKLTVYGHFKDKDYLFKQVIAEKIGQIKLAEDLPVLLKLSAKQALLKIGKQICDTFYSPEMLQLHRLMVAESARKPKIAAIFFEEGIGRATDALTRYFTAAHRKKQLNAPSAVRAAEHLFSLLTGQPYQRAVLGLAKPSTAALDTYRRDVVEVLLRTFRK